jgi:hypothetical protein
MKKVIRSSNLALRFYLTDGWTKDELDECCVTGEVKCFFPDDPSPYFSLTVGSFFDCFMLLDKASRVDRLFDKYTHMSDIQFLEQMNG